MPRKVDSSDELFETGSGRKEGQKLKPYLVMRFLLKETDKNHAVPAKEIAAYLQADCGINAERRSIYRDIEEINKAVLMLEENITISEATTLLENDRTKRLIVYDTGKKGFRVNVNRRHLSMDNARLLAECVYSARFIEREQAKHLVDIIAESVSEEESKLIRHDPLLTDRLRTDNKSVLDNLSRIDEAMNATEHGKNATPRKISFKYLKYTIQNLKKPIERRKGDRYVVSPYRLLISDGNYYLLGFDDAKQKMLTYRVDRMKDVRLMNGTREGAEAAAAIEISKYSQQCFSMFGGATTRVRVRFTNDLLDTMIDRFGKSRDQYARVDDEHFEITAEVRVSELFFAWVCGFGKRAKIVYPEHTIAEFKAFLDGVKSVYEAESNL